MKKQMTALMLVATVVGAPAFAAGGKSFSREYGSAGCGLGSVVVGKSSGFTQVFGATTNGTLINQSFGITFGTLNCIDSESAAVASRMDNFVTANRVAIANDIARGNGETLVVLSQLMNCSDQSKFNETLQQNFGAIFTSGNAEVMEITDSIISSVGYKSGEGCQI